MSNPHPDRPIAQPRRRLNRTTSTNSVGSVGSATGSTSPLANFSFGSPSSSVTAAKPPVQPSLGSFGASNPPVFNTQPNNNIGFQSGFGSPMTNPPVTSTNTPTIGFGTFGSPSVPSTVTNQPFGGLGGQNNTSTSSPSSSIGAFGSTSTSNAGGFQSGFGNASGSLFNSFGKPSQPQKIDDDSNMDSDEQPAAEKAPSFGGFGSNKPQTSTPAFSLNTSTVTTEQNKSTSAFPAFSFGKPATSSESTTTAKPFESSSSASPFGFKSTSFSESKDADITKETTSTQKPSAGFSFGSLNKIPSTSTANASTLSFGIKAPEEKSDKSAAPSPFASFGTPSKSTPSPFAGFGQSTSSAKITEISSLKSTDEGTDDLSKSTSSKPAATIVAPTFSFNSPSAKSIEKKSTEDDNKSSDKPTTSFGSFTNTSEKKSDEIAAPAFFKTSDIPSTFAGLKSASEVGSPSSVIANAASPAPTALESSSSEKEETTIKTSTDDNASEKEVVTSLFGQRRNSITSTTSDTSTQAVAAASPSPFASVTKETDKSTESSKAAPSFVSFGKNTAEGFSITKSSDSAESGSSFLGKPQKKPETIANDTITEEDDSSAKKDDKKPTFSFGNVAPAASSTEKPTSSPFSFNKPEAIANKPSPFTFSTTSASSTNKAADAPKSFSFGNTSNTNDKAEAPKPFSFNIPAPTGEKPSPFSFSSPVNNSTDKPASGFSFSSPAVTSSDSSSRKKRDRDADDDNNNDEQAHKKSFSFSPNPTSKLASASTPGFSFNTGTVGNKDTSSPFNYAATPVTKSAENTKEDTVVPTFTFGKSAPTTEKKDAGSSIFTFGAPATKSTENIEKKDTPKSFSFDSPATTTASDKKNFSFGAPPSTDASSTEGAKAKTAAATDSKKPTFSFGSPASTPSFGDKSSVDKANDATSKTDNAAKGTTLLHGKSPLSKSTSFLTNDTSSKDNESDKNGAADINKRVSFSLPGTSSATSSSSTKTSEPGSVSLAFSKVKGADDTTAPATLNLHPIAKKDTSSSGTTLQTTLKSTITDSNQITYKTRFWELPDDARNELALLAHFITEQTDKKDKIDQELSSYFGSTLKEMHTSALTMNDDAVILGEQLEVQSKSIDNLILLNKEQRLNAASASNVQQQESKNWRMRGATENWNFFNNSIANMEQRFGQLSETVTSVEEAINGLQSQVQFSPQNVGTMLDQQRRMYLSLAGRVAEIHQEADRIVKRRKLTK